MERLFADNNRLQCPTSTLALLISCSLGNTTHQCRQHNGLALPSRKLLVQKAKEAANMEWLKNRAVKLVGEVRARDWRELEVYFGKWFLEIHSNVEGKGCRISSGAVTVKLIPGFSLYNYYINLSNPTQALEYRGCNYELYVQKIIFYETSVDLFSQILVLLVPNGIKQMWKVRHCPQKHISMCNMDMQISNQINWFFSFWFCYNYMPKVHLTPWMFTGNHTVSLLDTKFHQDLFSTWLTFWSS